MWKRPCRSAATCITPSSSGFARQASRFRNPMTSRTANLRTQAKRSDSRQAGLSNDTFDPIGWGYEPSFWPWASSSSPRGRAIERRQAHTYWHDPQRARDCEGPDNAPDDLGRLPASAELHESSGFVAPSAFAHGYLVRGLLSAYRPGAGGGKVPSRLLRRPLIDARHVRARP